MKKLLIVESPAKIKTITKFLGNEFKIMSTMGHVKDLPPHELGIKIDKDIAIDYVVLEGKEKTLAAIRKEAKGATAIFLAPDPDREGEIIAWHVEQELLNVVKDPATIHRIAFNEITKSAIETALEHPAHVDLNKVAAQQARRVLDRLVGYEVSPILWKKVAKGLSAGRVQSVALKLICDREQEIKGFTTEEYWSIEGLFTHQADKLSAPLTLINKKKIDIKNQDQATDLVKKIEHEQYAIESIKDSKRAKAPAAPFMTSTLQQSGYNALGLPVQRTMQIAQKLYEGIPLQDPSTPVALITYMRTDSLRIAESALTSTRSFIAKNYGKEYVPTQAQTYAKKGKAQDAHEAIRPIDVALTPEFVSKYLDSDAAKLYGLIWKRFVACQMKAAQYAQRQVMITGGPYVFKATGSTLLFDGFLKVYSPDQDDKDAEAKTTIPANFVEGLALKLEQLTPKQHFTQPPPRFTEASLVKDLEKAGIGRPSTYATILKTIQARAYTKLDTKKRFVPTELGVVVTDMLTQNLPKIMDAAFTATMEEDLDKIAHGQLKRDALLHAFYDNFEKDLEAFRGGQAKKAPEKTELICPTCKEGNLAIRFGKAGPFAGCLNFPQCTFTSNFERSDTGEIILAQQHEPQLLEEACLACGKPLRKVHGRFGEFTACSGYPACKYIKPVKANFACLGCKTGDVIQRTWRGKKFWGCSNYPTCTFSISGDIEQTSCPMCKTPYLLKRAGGGVCSDKNCGYKQES